MGGVGKLTMGAVAILSLYAAAGSAHAQSLAGTWSCRAEQGQAAIALNVRVEGDGSSIWSFAAVGPWYGAQLRMEGRGQGRWALEGNHLDETVDDFTISSWSLDDRAMPPAEFPEEFRQALLAPGTPNTVVQLDDQTLVRENDDGDRLYCARSG